MKVRILRGKKASDQQPAGLALEPAEPMAEDQDPTQTQTQTQVLTQIPTQAVIEPGALGEMVTPTQVDPQRQAKHTKQPKGGEPRASK